MDKPFYAAIRKGLTALLIGTAINCYTPTREQEPQEITQISIKNSILSSYLSQGMKLEEHLIIDQEGNYVSARALLEKSIAGEKAKAYAEELAENAYTLKKEGGYKTTEDKIKLAKDTIDAAREYIQTEAHGQGNYTLKYEYNKDKEKLKRFIIEEELSEANKQKLWFYINTTTFSNGDSVQTFDEFLEPKDGLKLAGDCDDFSMALTTIYHGLKDYAEANRGRDEFFDALAEGLDSYRIFSVGIDNHVLNLSVTYSDNPNFEITMEAIEPQYKNKKITLEIINGYAYTQEDDTKKGLIISPVLRIFNRDFSAVTRKD